MKNETLKLKGLHCAHCTAMVKKSLEMVEGVESANVNTDCANVTYNDSIAAREQLEAAITRFGYEVSD